MRLPNQLLAVCFAALLCALATVPASAGTVYNNSTPQSYTINAYGISGVQELSDSFALTSPATISQVMFGNWLLAGDSLTSVDWEITTGAFSGSTLASGTASSFSSTFEGTTVENSGTWNMNSSVFSIPALSLSAGTYYLQLDDGKDTNGPGVYWDIDNGPSTVTIEVTSDPGVHLLPFDGGSETFALYGSTSATPEPSSFLLLGSGLAGLAGLIKRKVRA